MRRREAELDGVAPKPNVDRPTLRDRAAAPTC